MQVNHVFVYFFKYTSTQMPVFYLVFMGRNAVDLLPGMHLTLEDAWNHAKKSTEEYHKNGGRNLRLLHATFEEFLSAPRPSGTETSNIFIPDWIWGDYAHGGADTRRVMGECTIKKMY